MNEYFKYTNQPYSFRKISFCGHYESMNIENLNIEKIKFQKSSRLLNIYNES